MQIELFVYDNAELWRNQSNKQKKKGTSFNMKFRRHCSALYTFYSLLTLARSNQKTRPRYRLDWYNKLTTKWVRDGSSSYYSFFSCVANALLKAHKTFTLETHFSLQPLQCSSIDEHRLVILSVETSVRLQACKRYIIERRKGRHLNSHQIHNYKLILFCLVFIQQNNNLFDYFICLDEIALLPPHHFSPSPCRD